MRQAPHGFDVLGEHFDIRVHNPLNVLEYAVEIGRQRLYRRLRTAFLDLADAGGVMRGTAVRQVIAIH